MRIEAYRTREKPDLMILARHLLPKIRAAYEDPEFEKAFQEWKRKREEENHGQDS